MNALGYSRIAPDELIALVQQGVQPEFVAGMAAAGYDRLAVHDDKSVETLWDAKDTCRNLAGIGKIWQYPVWLEVLGFAQRALAGERRTDQFCWHLGVG